MLKLQPYERKFLADLKQEIAIPDEDSNMLFKIWRRRFGNRPNKSTAIRMPKPFLYPTDFFEESAFQSIFIQDGKCYDYFCELDCTRPFLNLQSSGFTSGPGGAPVYLLYGFCPDCSNS